jgi:hypothetical protein
MPETRIPHYLLNLEHLAYEQKKMASKRQNYSLIIIISQDPTTYRLMKTVFRIREILVWIRIRGSLPLTNGSGSCYFRLRPSRRLLLIFQR